MLRAGHLGHGVASPLILRLKNKWVPRTTFARLRHRRTGLSSKPSHAQQTVAGLGYVDNLRNPDWAGATVACRRVESGDQGSKSWIGGLTPPGALAEIQSRTECRAAGNAEGPEDLPCTAYSSWFVIRVPVEEIQVGGPRL